MKWTLFLLIGLMTLGLPLGVLAQAQNAERATKIAEARRQNAAMMRQYTWNSRTELIDKGKVADIRVDLVTYLPSGQLQRTTLNNEGSKMPKGFLRKDIAENKKKETEQYLSGLRDLLDQYTLPTAGKILDFNNTAMIQGPDAEGLLMLTGNNVVAPGDSLSIWVDQATHKMRKVEIQTTYQGSPVTANATYNTLPSGLNYMAFAEVEVPAKEMSLQVQNFDYNRSQ